MPVNRRAVSLAELIVVLALGGVVIAMFAHSVTAQRRAERSIAAATVRASAADEALQVIVDALTRVSASDVLIARGDTALEWGATLGVAVACVAGADTLVVPDSGSGAWWESPPDSGDVADVAGADGVWVKYGIVAVRVRSGSSCGASLRMIRLAPGASITGTSLVRVTRRTRFMLYKGGDGAWWLGSRGCNDAIPPKCDAAQPIAGPLAGPPSGVHFAIDSSANRKRISVSIAIGRIARSAVVELRP